MGGACSGVTDLSYDVSNGCGKLDGCLKSLCEIDFTFQDMILNENSTSVSDAVCVREQGTKKDSCCGSSPFSYKKFNSVDHYCEFDELVKRVANPLPDYLQDGSWVATSFGTYTHLGTKKCSVSNNDCQQYCQSLGPGSNLAHPQTIEEYEQYHQHVGNTYDGAKWVAFDILEDDRDIWDNINLCSERVTQPSQRQCLTTNNYTAKCVSKVACNFKYYQPLCVYDPSASNGLRQLEISFDSGNNSNERSEEEFSPSEAELMEMILDM